MIGWLAVLAFPAVIVAGEFTGEDFSEVAPEAEEDGFVWHPDGRVDVESSVLWADGIRLEEYSLGGRLTSDFVELGLTVARNTYALDYEPQIFGAPTSLEEEQYTYSLDMAVTLAPQWKVLGSASYYDGFSDYRSLWISEYYSQLFGEVPGYHEASPKGRSGMLGLEWEYIPVTGKLRLTAGYSKDTIAPSADIGENGLEQGRPNLYTRTLQFQTENVLTPRIVVQNTLQYTDTTNRDYRWSAQTAWNVALSEDWFLRLSAGGAIEDPNFDAYYFGGAIERRVAENWYVRLNARYYEDTGEIENSLGGFNSSAPSLKSIELGAGLRWQGVSSAINLYVGYYQTEYDPLAEDNAFLENLYNDRRWGLVQLNYTHTF